MNKRRLRDYIRLIFSILFFWIYFPHLIVYYFNKKINYLVNSDLERRLNKISLLLPKGLMFLYYVHNDRYFRTLFYHRAGPVISLLIGWWRPGDRYFEISKTTIIGEGAYMIHPFGSEINAKTIGKNFSCRHLTTIGNKIDGDNVNRPTIGDNVVLGVNVTVIGNVAIGNNVTIGAGSVVVKDIPDNCVAVGNPCKPIKFLYQEK